MLGQYLGLDLSWLPVSPSRPLTPRTSCFVLRPVVYLSHGLEGLLISHHRPDGSGRFIRHGDQHDIGRPPGQ